jgi:hypothetical protein
VARTRGARQASDGGGQVIRLSASIVLIPLYEGDYERVRKGKVTPLGLLVTLNETRRLFQ